MKFFTLENGKRLLKIVTGLDVEYDNSASGLSSTTTQEAIDELASKRVQYTQLSGSWDMFASNNWVTWSDARFGPAQPDWDLNLGTGTEPIIDWDGMGVFFPAGATLKKVVIKSRSNSNDVDAIQTFARVHDVDLTAGDPIDDPFEVNAVTVSSVSTVDLDAGPGGANDLRSFEIDLGDYTFTNDGDLHVCLRPDPGSISGNRQLRCTVYIYWELP